MTRMTKADLAGLKKRGRKICMLTAYDATSARLAAEGGVDLLLVGDSLAMTVLGYSSTKEVSLEEMLTLARAVRRGAPDMHIMGDMPIHTYDTPASALATARQFIGAGCDSIKFEGSRPDIARHLAADGIAVAGHIGLTPQTAEKYSVQGRSAEDRTRLLQEARDLAAAGISILIVECVPAGLGQEITGAVDVPVIGIGAGAGCDGQVLVFNDLVGLFEGFKPKFVRRYAALGSDAVKAVGAFVADVRSGTYPGPEESY